MRILLKNIYRNYLTEWKFNPPSSPWMVGIWEALVKSVKRALKSTIKDRLFTEEALYTTLCEVESLLNNRPLTSISDDVSDCECLTLTHFLIGELSPNFSPGIFTDKEINLNVNGDLYKQQHKYCGRDG